jgi:plasmid stabilization system protein ParE
VARLDFAARAEVDLDRIFQFVAAEDPAAAGPVIALIVEALQVLERHPLIGRPTEEGLRELVISRGKSGYMALYEYFEADDTVLVLALRHQRQAGYPGQA